jgi:anhydro-N-acetylmuramic acid kinase
VNPDLTCKLIKGINHKYPESLRKRLFEEGTVKDVCQLNFEVGKCFADAANLLISEFEKPDLIASHGQTIYHIPGQSTLQIGESAVIAQETGCLTVSNFREADIAAGGQGAPLVCFADEKWFAGNLLPAGEGRVRGQTIFVQNIGGIANVTVVSEKPTIGFDTGPGNVIIDYCMNKFFGKPYDKDGKIAAAGVVDESWLECLMQDEYYFMPPPKTTGREYFSPQYIENALKLAPPDPKDIIATVTALTAKSIVTAYQRFDILPLPLGEERSVSDEVRVATVIIGGGGAYNPALMKFLRQYLPKNIELKTHADYGISNNFKEAMAFALLGYCTYYGIPNNVPSCTGAKKRVILGKMTMP